MYNRIIIILLMIFSFIIPSKADYWQKIKNLPSGYENNYYLDVYFLPTNPNYGWICGFNSKILRTSNGGETWQGATISNNAYHLESIHFVNQNVGFCSGVQGIFKSSDGGATWSDISDLRMGNLWGCYFVNANVGIVVGEGCIDNIQRFWRTEDGGYSWTLFTTNEANSGMTDLILYDPNGLGYATGSGKLYVTYDGGRSWAKYRDTEIDDRYNHWQEEITRYRASFLLPLSGSSEFGGNACQGGYYGGGLYFSIDSGKAWNKVRTSAPMYGTFLLDTIRGWACGYRGFVCETEDAGLNWEMRNCGVFNNDLDDIFFINEYNAWVVGRGVWKLSRDSCSFTPDHLFFRGACFPDEKIDTLYFWNQSFRGASVRFDLINNESNSFSIVQPPIDNPIILPSCGTIRLIVKFSPDSFGHKAATLRATVNNTLKIDATLQGFSSSSTMKPESKILDFDTVYANTIHTKTLKFSAENPGEYISSIIPDKANEAITTDFSGYTQGNGDPYKVNFILHSRDTGKIEINYKVSMQPCNKDTIIKLKAYVRSGIINANDTTINLNCLPSSQKFLNIPITNTGNAVLNIDRVELSNPKAVFVGFASDKAMPAKLKINETDYLQIALPKLPTAPIDTLYIKINNNDSTLYYSYSPPPMADSINVLGKNPYTIRVIIENNYSLINTQRNDKQDFKLCYGDSAITTFLVKNLSFAAGNYRFTFNTVNCNFKTIYKIDNAYSINPGEVITYTVFIYPKKPGKFSLKLAFKSATCDDSDSLFFQGEAEDVQIIPNPSEINITKLTKKADSLYINIASRGYGTLTLDSVRSVLKHQNCNIKYDFDKKISFIDSTSYNLEIVINTSKDGIYHDTLLLYFSGICPKIVKIPVIIRSISSELTFNNLIKFNDVFCKSTTQLSKLELKNIGEQGEIIDSIIIINPAFKLGDYSFPLTIEGGKTLQFDISFTPIDTGTTIGEARIYSRNLIDGYLQIDLRGYFGVAKPILLKNFSNFDSLEYCDPIVYDTIYIRNDGNISSEISVDLGKLDGLDIDNDRLSIPAFSTKYLVISIDPSKLSKIGEIKHLIKLNSHPCPAVFDYNISLFKINKGLELKPSQITFSNLWAGLVFIDSANLQNQSNVPLKIKSVQLRGEASEYITFNGIAPGDILNIDEQRKVRITLSNPPEFTRINSVLEITYFSHCENLNKIDIKGEVPEEKYTIKIFSEKYRQMPNDSFNIKIICSDTLPSYVPIDSISFDLRYDRSLASLQEIKYNSRIVDFEKYSDGLSFTLRGNEAANFIKSPTQSISISSIAMLSLPDTTSLRIVGSRIFSPKRVNAIYENGFLTLYNYCPPIAEHSKFELITAKAKISTLENTILIDYSSSKDVLLKYQIYDELGKVIEAGFLPADMNGRKVIHNNLISGLYLIRISHWDSITAQKLIIITK